MAENSVRPTPALTIVKYLFSAIIIGVLVWLPFETLLSKQGILAIFKFFAADSFYYLSVANRSVELSFFSNDGHHVTNGFHPLWQILITNLFRSFNLKNQLEAQITLVIYLSLILVAIGSFLTVVALYRRTQIAALALIAVLPGFYYLICGQIDPLFGTLWGFANGMESALSICLFGILCLLFLIFQRNRVEIESSRSDLCWLLSISACLTAITVTRLDDIFFFIPFFILIWVQSKSIKHFVQRTIIGAAIPTAVIGTYIIYNLNTMGIPLPISGMMKGGLALNHNFSAVFDLIPPGLNPSWVANGQVSWQLRGWRTAQILIPAIGAVIYFVCNFTSDLNFAKLFKKHSWLSVNSDPLAFLLATYIPFKAIYNLINVDLLHQGHWYFALSILGFNFLTALALARFISPLQESPMSKGRLLNCFATILAIVFVLFMGNLFADTRARNDYNSHYARFFEDRAKISSELRGKKRQPLSIIEFDDGIMSYSLGSLGHKTLNGLGLTIDMEAYEAIKAGTLLDLAYRRGYRALGSLAFGVGIGPQTHTQSWIDEGMKQAYYLKGQNLEGWKFGVQYLDAIAGRTGAYFITFEPVNLAAWRAKQKSNQSKIPYDIE